MSIFTLVQKHVRMYFPAGFWGIPSEVTIIVIYIQLCCSICDCEDQKSLYVGENSSI